MEYSYIHIHVSISLHIYTLQEVAPLIAIGQHCLQVPKRPDLPPGHGLVHVMAFPYNYPRGTRRSDMKINWILFRGDDEMK